MIRPRPSPAAWARRIRRWRSKDEARGLGMGPWSTTTGRCPARSSAQAAERPTMPAPTTMTRMRSLHAARVVRAAAALRGHPVDVLERVLDIAGLAVDAVLGVDLEPSAGGVGHVLVDAGRAVALLGAVILRQVDPGRDARVLEDQVARLVLLVVGVGEEDRGQAVEGELAVGPRVVDAAGVLGLPQSLVVGVDRNVPR